MKGYIHVRVFTKICMVAFLERLPKAVLERAATKGTPDAGQRGFVPSETTGVRVGKILRDIYVPTSEHLV